MKSIPRTRTVVGGASLALVLAGAGTGTALAAGGGSVVRASGTCSGHTTWKLKTKADNSRLETEAQIDSNRKGQVWRVRLTDNGVRIFGARRTTKPPSGSFSVHKRSANRAGADQITLTARNRASGETCSGTLSFGG